MSLITSSPILIFVLIIIIVSIRQINQYERGVKFTIGKYVKTLEPGWHLILPIIQSLQKIDVRTKAVDVPDQEAITKDNISVTINAVIYYRVQDAAKAVIEVENFYYAVSQLAQTTMRNLVGAVELDNLLQNRDEISAKIQQAVDKATEAWGVDVESVELKDIKLPDDLRRTIAKQAEAEREKRAVIINSEGEVLAAANLAKAAAMLANTPGGLHLRTLQSINDMSSDQSNTTVWMVPLEVLRALEGLAKNAK